MAKSQYDIYKLSEDRERQMWQDAVFIFDSSALLDFYFLHKKARNKVFELFATELKDRLWIPSQVKYEYNKNRENIIKKPIEENYQPLKDLHLKRIKNSIKEIEKNVIDLKNTTKNDDKHPHVPQTGIDDFLTKIESFKKDSAIFEDSFVKTIIQIEEEINQLSSNDDVLTAITDYFRVGRYYHFAEIIEITVEGKHRYEYSIPPGYEDRKDKKGIQIFGDLIIWKQIIEYAKEIRKPIIFICNDLKEDWCHLDKTSTEKRIASPREELIKEIHDSAEIDFWMYNQPQFLYCSNKYFNTNIEKQNIDNLIQILKAKVKSPNELIFDCDGCGRRYHYQKEELDMNFECVGSDERNMGAENEYQAKEYLDCVECGNEIIAIFSVWEYPIGVHNYNDIEIDGAALITCFDFSIDFHDEPDPEVDVCGKCGEQFIDERQIGICDECDADYNK